MLYKIISIRHTGTKGRTGTNRTDDIYPNRIGRIVDTSYRYLTKCINGRAAIQYVLDENGNDYSTKMLVTSVVNDVWQDGDKLYVVTENSIYELEACL